MKTFILNSQLHITRLILSVVTINTVLKSHIFTNNTTQEVDIKTKQKSNNSKETNPEENYIDMDG